MIVEPSKWTQLRIRRTMGSVKAAWFIGGIAVGAAGLWVYSKAKQIIPGLGAGPDVGPLATHARQIRRYAFASSQDLSPIVGITHASYSLVLLDTLEELVGRDAIVKAGYDPTKLRKFITTLQDKHAEALKSCDAHLQQILKIERAEGMQTPGFVVAGAPRGA